MLLEIALVLLCMLLMLTVMLPCVAATPAERYWDAVDAMLLLLLLHTSDIFDASANLVDSVQLLLLLVTSEC